MISVYTLKTLTWCTATCYLRLAFLTHHQWLDDDDEPMAFKPKLFFKCDWRFAWSSES